MAENEEKQPTDASLDQLSNITGVEVPQVLRDIVRGNFGDPMVLARGFTIIEANDSYARLLGAPDAEYLRGRNIRELVEPESAERAMERYRRRIRGESFDSPAIYQMTSLDGRPVAIEMNAVLWPEDPTILFAIMRDVTAREEYTEQLRDSEKLYKAVADAVPMAVVLRGPDLRVVYANEYATTMTGFSNEELVNDAIINNLSPEDREQVVNTWKQRGEIPAREFEIRFKDRRKHWVLGGTRPVYDAKGNYVGMCNAFIDITDRKKAEEALEARTIALEGFLSAFPDIYLRMSADGVFLDCHAGEGSQLYADPEDFLGKPVDQIMPRNLAKMTRSRIRSVLRSGKLESYEYDLELGGEQKTYEARMSPFDNGVVIVVQDITRRKAAELALQQAITDLEDLYRAQQDILNNVTHEVRTPLTAVIGYIKMILEGIAGPITDQQETMLRKSLDASNQLMRLIDTALQESRVRRSPTELRLKRSRPTRIALNAAAVLRQEAESKGISLCYYGPETHKPAVYDPDRIRTVLYNLIRNAIKYTDPGGTVDVIASDAEGGSEIIIADTGWGIPEEELPNVFTRFRQVNRPGQRKSTGLGLGLTIVEQAIEAMNATMVVSSAEDVGTAFTVYLPSLDGPSAEEPSRGAGGQPPKPGV